MVSKAANTEKGWKNCNLRTQFKRIVKRAGLKPCPVVPRHAGQQGNGVDVTTLYPRAPRIALKHYLTATDADFEQATKGDAESSANVAQNRAQQPDALSRTDSQETKQAPAGQGLVRDGATNGDVMPDVEVAGAEFGPVTAGL